MRRVAPAAVGSPTSERSRSRFGSFTFQTIFRASGPAGSFTSRSFVLTPCMAAWPAPPSATTTAAPATMVRIDFPPGVRLLRAERPGQGNCRIELARSLPRRVGRFGLRRERRRRAPPAIRPQEVPDDALVRLARRPAVRTLSREDLLLERLALRTAPQRGQVV